MFWNARQAVMTGARQDAYSVLLHDDEVHTPIVNDLTSSPDDLLNQILPFEARLGTNFERAFRETQSCMEANWDAERYDPHQGRLYVN